MELTQEVTQAIQLNKVENTETVTATVTAYSSEVGQTDSTPFITANGDTVGRGTIACPIRLKFGTVVEINGTKYKCNDRMHTRYQSQNYFDIWFPTTKLAYQWGTRRVQVIIYTDTNGINKTQRGDIQSGADVEIKG